MFEKGGPSETQNGLDSGFGDVGRFRNDYRAGPGRRLCLLKTRTIQEE